MLEPITLKGLEVINKEHNVGPDKLYFVKAITSDSTAVQYIGLCFYKIYNTEYIPTFLWYVMPRADGQSQYYINNEEPICEKYNYNLGNTRWSHTSSYFFDFLKEVWPDYFEWFLFNPEFTK